MILRISTVGMAVLLVIPCAFFLVPMASVRCAPKVGAPKAGESKEEPFPWQGQALPIPLSPLASEFEGEFRNEQWQIMARDLRVRDLRVYDWPSAYNKKGEAEKQRNLVVERLRRAGYKVQKFTWEGYNPADTEGFEAYRATETLSAMWRNNGSHLLLYWGHQVPETPAQNLNDDLLQAVAAEDFVRVQAALQAGANPYSVDYSGESVLSLATNTGDIPVVKALLRAQHTANSARGTKLNIGKWLDFAAERDDAELLQLFIDRGATPQQIGAALQVAAQHGATKCATLLLPHAPRAAVNSALWQAAFVEEWRGSAIQHPDIVKLLLTRRPDKRALDTALVHVAGFDDQGIVVPLLLAAGAAPNASDDKGETALIHALRDYDSNSVRTLLKAGADPNAHEADGTPALIMALGTPFDFDELLKQGADPNARNTAGQTALDIAREARDRFAKKAEQKGNWRSKDDQRFSDRFGEAVRKLEAATQLKSRETNLKAAA